MCPHCHKHLICHGGFCCVECHAAYMAEQHKRWDRPGTATGFNVDEECDRCWWGSKKPWSGVTLVWHFGNYLNETDESFGYQPIAIRAMEDAGNT